jgi:creatinine amidohydrolase/Fe(II)-dependent formamide hydrolase-like protein
VSGRLPIRLGILALFLLALGVSEAARTLPPAPPRTLQMRDMTWPEVHAAIQSGSTSVIVPTGGIEQNGPHMILAKHDHIVGFAAQSIAERLGRTLVAPTVSFVPEGDYDPPTGNMQWPGTIGVPEKVFEQMLEGIARSLKLAGFRTIVFIGDHGQSQPPQEKVAAALTREWAAQGVRVVHSNRYYDDAAQNARLKAEGETAETIGFHAGLIDTSELMAVLPSGVDLERLQAIPRSLAQMGASGDPSRATPARGQALLAIRIAQAVEQISALRAGH